MLCGELQGFVHFFSVSEGLCLRLVGSLCAEFNNDYLCSP